MPTGEGIIELRVDPVDSMLRPLDMAVSDRPSGSGGAALSSRLRGRAVSERMANECKQMLAAKGMEADIRLEYDDTARQAGAPCRSSESIGRSVAEALLTDLATGATVDRHLADQIVLFASLVKGTSRFRIPSLTDHVETDLWLCEEMLGSKGHVEDGLMTVEGVGFHHRGGR